MSKAEEYKRHAAECAKLSQVFRDPGHRAVLMEMAAMWLRLAEHVEAREDTDK
jgi:hypothetical protein